MGLAKILESVPDVGDESPDADGAILRLHAAGRLPTPTPWRVGPDEVLCYVWSPARWAALFDDERAALKRECQVDGDGNVCLLRKVDEPL